MALPKLYDRVNWDNNTTPAINEDNLNSLSKAVDDIDDRVIALAGTIMEDVPQIQEDIEELEADMALIDTKIASATAEANRATTAANNAAVSATSAGNKALVSEGWAKGTQNGTAVGSTSPYYHNNAEYFKNQARSFTPQGYQDLVDDVDSLKETFTNSVGDLTDLDTTDKTSIVAAINELFNTPHASVQDWSNEYVLFLGDSYLNRQTSQGKTIVDLICSNLGITDYTNDATGGASFAGGQIETQVDNADASVPYTQCVILAGINDARFSNVVSTSPIPAYNVFKSALGRPLTKLKAKYPQLKSVYLGYIGSRTLDATDGQGNFESIGASTYGYIYDGMRLGYKYLNGVENIMHRSLDDYASDGLHPSELGIYDIANGVSNALITGSVETKLPLHDLLTGASAVNNTSAGTGNNFRVVMSNDHFNFTIREGGITNFTTAHSATQGSDLQLYSNLYDKFETDIYMPIFVDVIDNGTTTHEKALLHLNNRDMFIIFLDASHTAISRITTHFATADYPYTYIN